MEQDLGFFFYQYALTFLQRRNTQIHGDKAHSCYISEDAFKKLKGDNKELMIIPGTTHVDLYDNKANMILFDKIEHFFRENLK